MVNIVNTRNWAYHSSQNLPSSYNGANFANTLYFDFIPQRLEIYSGSIADLGSRTEQIQFLIQLQESYTGTTLENREERIRDFMTIDVDENNPSNSARIMASAIVKSAINSSVPLYDPQKSEEISFVE